jgi:hypothetical protein
MAIGGSIAVTVAIIAVPARSAWRIGLNGCIDYRERLSDRRIIGRQETKAN